MVLLSYCLIILNKNLFVYIYLWFKIMNIKKYQPVKFLNSSFGTFSFHRHKLIPSRKLQMPRQLQICEQEFSEKFKLAIKNRVNLKKNCNNAIATKDKIDVCKFLVHAKVFDLLNVTFLLGSPIDIESLAIHLDVIRHILDKSID